MEAALARLEAVTQRLEAVAATQHGAAPSRAYAPLAAAASAASAAAAAAPQSPAAALAAAPAPTLGAGPGIAAWREFMQTHFTPVADLTPGLGDEVKHAASMQLGFLVD